MIGRLRGCVVHDEATGSLILDVGGVGYEMQAPIGTVGRAARVGGSADEIIVYVHTNLRQDALDLFGFASLLERATFRQLTHVPNVGPKLALAVLNVLPVAELSEAIENEDKVRLSKVPGVGKKTAERLILELRGKLPRPGSDATPPGVRGGGQKEQLAERLVAALTGLGYRPAEAERACGALMQESGAEMDLSTLLRKALHFLSA
jgi:holliday junction DNA helicase RuvA